MANLEGLDVDAVRAMGRRMQSEADRVRSSIVRQIDHLVAQIPGIWRGPDADRFRGWWTGEHRARILAVADALHGLGQSALNNAAEQEQTSSGGGASAASWMTGVMNRTAASLRDVQDSGTPVELSELMRQAGGMGSAMLGLMGDLPRGAGAVTGALTLATIGSTASDYGWSDARTIDAEIDGAMGTGLGLINPAMGLAWYMGHDLLGKPIASAADHLSVALTGQDMGSNAYDAYISRTYGDVSHMSIDQQSSIANDMVERYSGWSGFGHFLSDSAGNNLHSAGSAIGSAWHWVAG